METRDDDDLIAQFEFPRFRAEKPGRHSWILIAWRLKLE